MLPKTIKTMIFNECALLRTTLKTDDFVGFSLPIKSSNKDFIANKLKEIQSYCRDDYSIYKLRYLIQSFKSWCYLINLDQRKKIDVLCYNIPDLIDNR